MTLAMACSIDDYWNMRTFTHDRNGLIQRRWDSRIQCCIVASSCVDLLGAKEREHLSDEVGSIRFRGKSKNTAFESIRNRQKYVLEETYVSSCHVR
jgi:hypothetical protein